MKTERTALILLLFALWLSACNSVTVPDTYEQKDCAAKIYPDYADVTIPVNIAPLSFQIEQDADEMITRFSCEGNEIVCKGLKAMPDEKEWKELVRKAKGKAVSVEVFLQNGTTWYRYKPLSLAVSPDSIDPYISYRLISPSYITYEDLTINQRCLENYDETVIYDNMLCSRSGNEQCINCHNYQQYNPQRMQFHARQYHGGTFITYDGKTQKVNMKNDSVLSAGVYPAWHPWLPIIVYSTNLTEQVFHTRDINKIEVFDAQSDLVAYDVVKNEITNIENQADEFEVFPCWSPDGKWLYYCSAHFEFQDSTANDAEVVKRYKEVKYNIYRKAFNPDTYTFGQRELVYDAVAEGKSATLPRISPDGHFLLFTMGEWGCFHIWHRDADLYLMNLKDLTTRPLSECNSNNTESYHSWSSNGRWIIFSSRRDDGAFTRPFMAHIGKDGKGSKPFELPQRDPEFHRLFMKSYNIPEFMRGPVAITAQDIADVLKGDGLPQTKYVDRLTK